MLKITRSSRGGVGLPAFHWHQNFVAAFTTAATSPHPGQRDSSPLTVILFLWDLFHIILPRHIDVTGVSFIEKRLEWLVADGGNVSWRYDVIFSE